jgi:hypothetical protein
MTGSKAQKASALNLAATADPNQNLADALRRQQARSTQTAQEEAQVEKSQNLASLGGLGDRVHNFIQAQRAKLSAANATFQAGNEATMAGGSAATTEQMAAIKPLLQQLAANPTDMQLQLQVNKALGYDSNRQLSPAEISNLYTQAIDSISASGAEAVDNTLNVDDLIQQPDFGYTKAELAQLLGVPEDAVGQMSVGTIRGKVNEIMANEFSTSAQTDQQAQSGQLGVAERGLARQAGREASATGTRATEADVAKLEQSIANAENVSFGGQVMPVEQMLSDENISKTITDYMNAAPGSPQRTQLEATEPQLVDFIKRNETVLADAAASLGQGASQFQNIQTSNKNTATLGGLLSDDLAAQLVPGFGELAAANLDPSQVPVLAVAQNMTPVQKQTYTGNLAQLAQKFPMITEELKDLDANELAQLDLANPNGKWNMFIREQERYQDIMNTPSDDLDGLISKIYDVGGNANFEEDLRLNAANLALGLMKKNPALDIIDNDHDGVPDSVSAIRAKLVKGSPSLRDAIAGKSRVAGPSRYSSTEPVKPFPAGKERSEAAAAGDKDAVRASIMDRLGGYANDGEIDASDVQTAFTRGFDPKKATDLKGQQNELNFLLSKAQLDADGKQVAEELKARNVEAITADYLKNKDVGTKQFGDELTKIYEHMSNNRSSAINIVSKAIPTVAKSVDALIKQLRKDAKNSNFYDKLAFDQRIAELNAVKTKMRDKVAETIRAEQLSRRYVDTERAGYDANSVRKDDERRKDVAAADTDTILRKYGNTTGVNWDDVLKDT